MQHGYHKEHKCYDDFMSRMLREHKGGIPYEKLREGFPKQVTSELSLIG